MITNQAYLFLIFILNGIIIGLLFDFFRILRKTIKTKDIITYLEDFIFWILTGTTILYSVFTFNNGEIRLYMFIAILIGIITYMLFVSRYFIDINVTIINTVKNIIIKIVQIISIPFTFIFKTLRKILMKPIWFCFINIRKKLQNQSKIRIIFLKKIKIM